MNQTLAEEPDVVLDAEERAGAFALEVALRVVVGQDEGETPARATNDASERSAARSLDLPAQATLSSNMPRKSTRLVVTVAG